MDINQIVFDTYVICPLCKAKMRSLSGSHLLHKHGYPGIKEFKLEFGIPMGVSLIAGDVRAAMQKHGKRRSQWFRENAMPLGIKQSQQSDLVPKELRTHSGLVRRGMTWMPAHISSMRDKGWLDLHDAAELLGIAYNYARKCASDGRIKTITEKGIRFTRPEWVEEARKLLLENRKKYRPNLTIRKTQR